MIFFTSEQQRDALLVRQTLSGRSEAYAELLHRHLGPASAFALSRLRTKEDAEDVTQESFVRAYEKLDTLRDPSKFGPWLFGIIRNTAARLRERRRTEASLTATVEEPQAPAADFANSEMFAELRRLVDSLSDTQREIVLLHYFSKLKTREIAALLEMSPAAVRKQLERGRKQLGRQMLEQASSQFEWDRDLAKKTLALVAASSVSWLGASASASTMATISLGWFASPIVKVVAVLIILGAVAAVLRAVDSGGNTDQIEVSRANTAVAQERGTEPTQTAAIDLIDADVSEDVPTEVRVAAAPSTSVADTDDDESESDVFIFGAALDAEGKPVADANVSIRLRRKFISSVDIHRQLGPVLASATTRTDARGEFTFDTLNVAGHVNLICEIEVERAGLFGFMRYVVPNGGLCTSPLDVVVVKTEPLAGRVVTLEGQPIAGATLTPMRYESRVSQTDGPMEDLAKFTTDASGRFSTTHLYAGRWQFLVQAEGRAPLDVDFIETGNSDAEIKLSPGSRLSGRVLCSSCELPPDARIFLMNLKRGNEIHVADVDAASGRFEFPSLRESDYFLAFEDRGLTPVTDQMITVPGGGALITKDVTVANGGEIEGRLIDASTREPIAGVEIRTEPLTSRQFGTTDAQGYFRIAGIPRGEYWITFGNTPQIVYMVGQRRREIDPAVIWPPQPLSVASNSRITFPDWPIDRRYRMNVKVVDVDGTPAKHAIVELRPRGSGAVVSSILEERTMPIRTDASGNVTVYLPKPVEELYVRAIARGKASREAGPVSVSVSPLDVTLQLEAAGSISGRLIGRSGQAEKGRSMTLTGATTGPVLRKVWDGMTYLTSLESRQPSSHTGRFYFGSLVADSYTLTSERSANSTTVDLAAGEHRHDVEFSMYPGAGAVLTGHITMRGEPMQNCRVSVGSEDVRTDKDGRFSVAKEAGQPKSVAVALRRSYRAISINQTLKASRGAPILNQPSLDLEFGRGPVTVEGVLYRNGQSWANKKLTVVHTWPDGVEETFDTTTSYEGKYRFEGLPEGESRIKVDALMNPGNEEMQPTVEVNLPSGFTTGHDLYLEPGRLSVEIYGMTTNEAGIVRLLPGEQVVTELSVEVIQEMSKKDLAGVIVETDGPKEIDVFEPGRYTLYVAAYDKNAQSVTAALPTIRFRTAPIEILLNHSTSIVVDLDRGVSAAEITKMPAPASR